MATLAVVLYSLLSVPLALRFLSVDEFGLFVLCIQIAGYFNLLEIGMSAATARILIDYKDSRDDKIYGSVILTGLVTFALQGFSIMLIGLVSAPWIVSKVGIPSVFSEVATLLLRWLAVASGFSLAFKIFSSVLYANKRLDLIHIFMSGSMVISLVLIAVILHSGAGLPGLVWLFLGQAAMAIILPLVACYKLGLLPSRGKWGQPTAERFRELFIFAKDVFLVNVGNHILEASQLIIVTRSIGLTAAAVWSVSTKLFALVYQLVVRIEGTAIVFFAEMMVRGERDKLATRFRQIYQLTAGTAVVALAVVVAVNESFVSVWAEPSLAWALPFSALLACSIFLNALTRCSGDLIIHTKNIASFRYVYFVEAAVFVVLALWLGARFGFYGILGSSLICLVLFRASYTTYRMAHYFRLPAITFWWTWLKRPIVTGFVLLPFVVSAGWLAGNVSNVWAQLFIESVWVGIPAAIALLFVAVSPDVKKELVLRWPQFSFLEKAGH